MGYMVVYSYNYHDKWSNPSTSTLCFGNAFLCLPRTLKQIIAHLETTEQTNPPTKINFAIINILPDTDPDAEREGAREV